VTKSEFERRAAEMKARNLTRPRFRMLSPPRSIFAPPLATPFPATVYVRDFLREVDIKRLSPPLAVIKKLGKLETDRDGLLDLTEAGLQISVSPDLLLRGIQAYDAVLRLAAERDWPLKIREGVVLRIIISGEPLELAVTEKTDPIMEVKVRPGERRPRRPTGALVVSLTAGYRKVMISDKRDSRIESKLDTLFTKAEALASEVHARNERFAEMRRREEVERRRGWELEARIERLDRNMAAWRRAECIRAYAQAMSDRLTERGPIDPDSDVAKWLAWAQRYADRIDPMCGTPEVKPQEFWESTPSQNAKFACQGYQCWCDEWFPSWHGERDSATSNSERSTVNPESINLNTCSAVAAVEYLSGS
jgi:hypothetical protein